MSFFLLFVVIVGFSIVAVVVVVGLSLTPPQLPQEYLPEIRLVLSWPIVQRWNRDKRKRRLGGESQVLQSGTQVGGKSGGHGREKRERVARSQPGWGGWHAWTGRWVEDGMGREAGALASS